MLLWLSGALRQSCISHTEPAISSIIMNIVLISELIIIHFSQRREDRKVLTYPLFLTPYPSIYSITL